jgi:hypothetical protein
MWQKGFNEGEGQSAGGASSSMGETRSQTARPFRLSQELMNMKPGTGRMWLLGMGDRSVPFFAPNYWHRPDVVPLVDENPYRAAMSGGAASAAAAPAAPGPSASAAAFGKNPLLAAAFIGGCILAAWLVFAEGNNSHQQQHQQISVHPARR